MNLSLVRTSIVVVLAFDERRKTYKSAHTHTEKTKSKNAPARKRENENATGIEACVVDRIFVNV